MKLEEAIENIQEIQTDLADQLNAANLLSLQLGKEALERRQETGGIIKDILGIPLPGETEDLERGLLMDLERAIEIKEIYCKGGEIPSHSEYREADRLSIEAMKRLQDGDNLTYGELLKPLPGETED
ncbi:hypothetical protein ES703_09969 [subsurface metagenome]